MDNIFVINRATGQIKWKLGGTAVSKDDAQIIQIAGAPDTAFFRQHDARFLPNGNISLFDDHTAMPGVARGVEYAIDFTAGTAQLAKQYQGPAASQAMGSFRDYSDGSRVVGWGFSSNLPNLAMTEFGAAGGALLDLEMSSGAYSYRVLKEPLSSFDVSLFRQPRSQP